MRNVSVWMSAVALLCIAGAARAGDQFPPSPSNPFAPWNRGDPFTTYNIWQFHTPSQQSDQSITNPTVPPGVISNPDGSVWQTTGPQGGDGVWCVPPGGFLEFLIQNYQRPEPKIVYVQLKFFGPVPQVGVFDPGNPGVIGTPWIPDVTTPSPYPGGGLYWSTSLCLPYNPAQEIVRISNPAATDNIYLEQVVIDTLCTPAPGAAALLGLGAVMAVRRRR